MRAATRVSDRATRLLDDISDQVRSVNHAAERTLDRRRTRARTWAQASECRACYSLNLGTNWRPNRGSLKVPSDVKMVAIATFRFGLFRLSFAYHTCRYYASRQEGSEVRSLTPTDHRDGETPVREIR